jgi:DNA-binding LytR/AlgR family response regulator
MAKIKVLLVEDDKIFSATTSFMVNELGYELVGTADNAEEAKTAFFDKEPDIVLLDIRIKGNKDGIELAEDLMHYRGTPFIFLTSFNDKKTFLRAKETSPYAYIVKPFDKDTLERAIELALHKFNGTEEETDDAGEWGKDLLLSDSFFVKVGDKLEKVILDEIQYIEVDEKYCSIFNGERNYAVRISLNDLALKLPSDKFLRINRKQIVNADMISKIDVKNKIVYIGRTECPLGKSYKDLLLKKLNYIG